MRRINSSVRERARSFNLAAVALRRIESGDRVRAFFEGLLFSDVTNEAPSSSTPAEPGQRHTNE
jgi:hypothetical protein